MNLTTENPLVYERISKLLRDFAIPSVTATLVTALYNIGGQRYPTALFQLFTAIGRNLTGLLLSLTQQVFFLIPLIFLLPLHFGIFYILLAGPIADFLAFVVSVLLVRHEFKALTGQQKPY